MSAYISYMALSDSMIQSTEGESTRDKSRIISIKNVPINCDINLINKIKFRKQKKGRKKRNLLEHLNVINELHSK